MKNTHDALLVANDLDWAVKNTRSDGKRDQNLFFYTVLLKDSSKMEEYQTAEEVKYYTGLFSVS